MSVCWLFMILLGCRLSHASQSPNTSQEKVISICGSGKDEVHVPCPDVTGQDMSLSLYKDQEVISNHTCNYENNTLKCVHLGYNDGVKLHENTTNKSFGFILHGLTDSSQGIYSCKSTVLYPPPLKLLSSNVRIRLRVEGHQCKCKESSSKCEKSLDIWIWSAVVVLLIIYSLTVTIIAFVIWVKLRKADSQSDYMNTKPRAPRERRKKRGVQHPIPRHF